MKHLQYAQQVTIECSLKCNSYSMDLSSGMAFITLFLFVFCKNIWMFLDETPVKPLPLPLKKRIFMKNLNTPFDILSIIMIGDLHNMYLITHI